MNFSKPGMAIAVLAATIGLAAGATTLPSPARAAEGFDNSASVVMYHRFGEADYPSTNIRLDQFDLHLNELKTGGYNVMALDKIIDAVINNSPLPKKTVAITIDDAYLSVYTKAWPKLKKAGFPFTLFVSTNAVDRADSGQYKRYMTWAQVKEMESHPLATIANHTASHLHMIDANEFTNRREIEKSQDRMFEKLGIRPNIIAYPYGEFSNDVIKLVREMGFIAGFGQHSGAFGPGDNMLALPRFTFNENYGDIARFKTGARALAIKTQDFSPAGTVIKPMDNPPALGFSITDEPVAGVSCFSSHEGKLQTERLGQSRIEVRMEQPLPQGRTRINCTAPGPDGRWYWLGRLFYVKKPN